VIGHGRRHGPVPGSSFDFFFPVSNHARRECEEPRSEKGPWVFRARARCTYIHPHTLPGIRTLSPLEMSAICMHRISLASTLSLAVNPACLQRQGPIGSGSSCHTILARTGPSCGSGAGPASRIECTAQESAPFAGRAHALAPAQEKDEMGKWTAECGTPARTHRVPSPKEQLSMVCMSADR